MSMIERIHQRIDGERAVAMLRKYRSGSYSGYWFETIGGPGDAPDVADRFTAADLVALSTLSIELKADTAIDLLHRRAPTLNRLLAAVPTHIALGDASDGDLEPLWPLQDALDRVGGVRHVTRSKLLARKRPRLVPVRDQHVLRALVGSDHGSLTVPLRDALHGDPGITARLEQIARDAGCPDMPVLRVLDIVVWMIEHGDAQVPDPPGP